MPEKHDKAVTQRHSQCHRIDAIFIHTKSNSYLQGSIYQSYYQIAARTAMGNIELSINVSDSCRNAVDSIKLNNRHTWQEFIIDESNKLRSNESQTQHSWADHAGRKAEKLAKHQQLT